MSPTRLPTHRITGCWPTPQPPLCLDLVVAGGSRGSVAKLLAQDGTLFLSTINRTPASYALGILFAEYVAGWVPRGTHDWRRFVTPEELAQAADAAGLELVDVCGMTMNPLSGAWSLTPNLTELNYIAALRHRQQ